MNVSLTPELMRIVHSKVESGLYNNASEVVREAIRRLDEENNLLHELKLSQLRKALEPGLLEAKRGEYADYSLESLIWELDSRK